MVTEATQADISPQMTTAGERRPRTPYLMGSTASCVARNHSPPPPSAAFRAGPAPPAADALLTT
jgi:hypothetical protein